MPSQSFYHQEETVLLALLLGEEVDGCPCDVGQRQVALAAVDGVWQTVAVSLVGLLSLEQNHTVGLAGLLLVVLISICYRKSLVGGLLI